VAKQASEKKKKMDSGSKKENIASQKKIKIILKKKNESAIKSTTTKDIKSSQGSSNQSQKDTIETSNKSQMLSPQKKQTETTIKEKKPIRFIPPSMRLREVPGAPAQQSMGTRQTNTRSNHAKIVTSAKSITQIASTDVKKPTTIRRFIKRTVRGTNAASFRTRKQESFSAIVDKKERKTVQRKNPVPGHIKISESISIAELARKMNLKASELIGKLMSMGMMVTINQSIDADTAEILAAEYNCKITVISFYDETIIETEEDKEESLSSRPPVVTIMGHVDHGKTSLLDAIRDSRITDQEAGAITQHIGAYQVDTPKGIISFLDTPGHEAFTLMRARGAQITDIVLLIVAANDGIKPQTVEAINHIKETKVPVIVVITKMDLPDADPKRIKQQLSEYNILSEDWGGQAQFVEVSSKTKKGISQLLEAILLQSEILELKCNHQCRAEGRIIESMIDIHLGRVATVLIQKGTLKISDPFVAGIYAGKVRALINDQGIRIQEASPSTPVQVLGFDGIAEPGDPFQVTKDERIASQVSQKRQELRVRMKKPQDKKQMTLDNLYESIKENKKTTIKIVIKGDTHGSVEALRYALEQLSDENVRVFCIHTAVGAVNETDVVLAVASSAIIVGFHVRAFNNAAKLAEREKIKIYRFNIIYEAVDAIKAAIEGTLTPELEQKSIGVAEVRKVFKVPKLGKIAGCYVSNGKAIRNAKVQIFRDGKEIYSGNISALKRFKDDVKEVSAGFECGMAFEKFSDLQELDQIEIYQLVEKTKRVASTNKFTEGQGDN